MTQVVVVIGVAAVDDRVPRLERVGQRGDRPIGDVARGNHHPRRPRLLELGGELLERRGPGSAVRLDGLDRISRDVVAHATMPVPDQAANEPGAHPPQPDHPELHWRVGGQGDHPTAAGRQACAARQVVLNL